MDGDDPLSLDAIALEAIARRIAREPVYWSDVDCRLAVRDRRDLFGALTQTIRRIAALEEALREARGDRLE